MIHPLQGEIWQVTLDPTVGEEMQKARPGLVLSTQALLNYGTRIIVPLTEWKAEMARRPWFVPIDPDALNNLDKASAAACHQVRCLSLSRFSVRIGRASASFVHDVRAGMALCLDIQMA